jgi:NitT/TauT family transport system ATP-binding protein
LEGVELGVRQGEFVSIVGPSGCGKSTLLSVIAGLFTQFQGSVRIAGKEVRGPQRDVGLIFQEDSTFPWRTALRNVEFGLEMRGLAAEVRRCKALDILALVGLTGYEHLHPGQLSGGMKQRVTIARTLEMNPALLLMDEPFGALDEQTRILLGEELLRIQDALGQTILFVTHNIQESVLLSDRVVVLSTRPGRVKATVAIDLPRPRDSGLLASAHFAELVGEISSVLREESIKAFRLGVPDRIGQ